LQVIHSGGQSDSNSAILQIPLGGPRERSCIHRDRRRTGSYRRRGGTRIPVRIAASLFFREQGEIHAEGATSHVVTPVREDIIVRTSSGIISVNNNVVQFLHPNLLYSCINNSGIGAAQGFYGFKAFSHERAILRDKISVPHLLFSPYTSTVKKLINLTVRLLR
jgi:hypothetical protein